MNAIGIFTCHDLAEGDPKALSAAVGSQTITLMNLAKGIDPRPVVSERETKSISNEKMPKIKINDKEIEFDDDYNSDGHIFIKQDQPLPASILAIYPTLVTNDG